MSSWWIRLLRYAAPFWRSSLAILALMLMGVGLGLLAPWPLKLIVDNVLTREPLPRALGWFGSLPGADTASGLLVWLAVSTVGIFFTQRLTELFESYLRTGVGYRMVYALGVDLFETVQRSSLRFHSARPKGDLMRRITADTSCVKELSLNVVLPLCVSLATLVAMFAIMWRLSRPLALLALAVALPLGIVVRTFARPMTERKLEHKRLQGEMMSLAERALTALPIVQAFNQEGREDRRFRHASERTVEASLRATRVKLRFRIVAGMVTALATSAVMVVGGLQVLAGSLSVGALLVLLSYFAALYAPLSTMAYLSDDLASAEAGAHRVLEALDAGEETLSEATDAIDLAPVRGRCGRHIRLADVTFGYESNRPVLDRLTLEVAPGETVALVGPTGAGKSTLISLILRFFDPLSGSVSIDGQDLRGLRLESLRAQISLVLQEPFLLPLSIADNIAYSRPGADRQEVVDAARAARAHDFIQQLPLGYETVIGERGATLSAGERQRLAIARALLRNAPILLLDEPTSALDAHTESRLLDALEALMKDRTTILITHRLSTARGADRIVSLTDGRIAEASQSFDSLAS